MRCLLFLACFAFIAVASGQFCCEGGTMCPFGCCPEDNWDCCPDNIYCAAIAADCPFVTMKEKLVKMASTAADRPFVTMKEELVKMAARKQCDGTMCPGGCCPEENWYCCPDDWCAATAADCPFVSVKEKLVKMAATAADC